MAEDLGNRFARQSRRLDLLRRQFAQQGFLLRGGFGVDTGRERQTEVFGHFLIQLRRIAACTSGHLAGQQRRDQAVLVRRPHRAVQAQERCPGAFFTTKAQRAVKQAIGKPFKADRHFVQATAQTRSHTVNQTAADYGFAHCRIGAPVRTVLEQVVNGHRQIVVRRQQAARRGHDAMAVVVGVTGKSHVKTLFKADQPLHCVAGGWVHADAAIPVHAHKAERWIDRGVDHFKVQPVVLADCRPVTHTGTAQRVYA